MKGKSSYKQQKLYGIEVYKLCSYLNINPCEKVNGNKEHKMSIVHTFYFNIVVVKIKDICTYVERCVWGVHLIEETSFKQYI